MIDHGSMKQKMCKYILNEGQSLAVAYAVACRCLLEACLTPWKILRIPTLAFCHLIYVKNCTLGAAPVTSLRGARSCDGHNLVELMRAVSLRGLHVNNDWSRKWVDITRKRLVRVEDIGTTKTVKFILFRKLLELGMLEVGVTVEM